MTVQLNFTQLKHYATLFRVYVWVKRLRMIALRLGFAVLIGWVLYLIMYKPDSDISYQYEGAVPFYLNPFYWLLAWFFANWTLFAWMGYHWQNFARVSGLTQTQNETRLRVPSFRGKRLTPYSPMTMPLEGVLDGRKFGFFTRIYKEGGLLRWRERKMDTILWLELPRQLPRIVVDSRHNERARRSNLSRRYNKSQLLHFEGTVGDKYYVYAASGNQVAVLQLFTPDVLEVFFEHLPDVDIELKGKTIWFVWRYAVLDDQVAARLFAGMTMFMHELNHQLATARFSQQEIERELI